MAVSVLSLGCRLNEVEGETIRLLATEAGFADLAVVNTCAVTAEAVRQSGQAIRRASREAPGRPVVATGCAATIEPGRFAAMGEVALVLGNSGKTEPATWAALARERLLPRPAGALPAPIRGSRPSDGAGPLPAATDAAAGRVRAFVQVQTGCDHDCTFCTIPHGRGRSRSAPVSSVVGSVRDAVAAGAREAVLTGVDLTAYGADLPGPESLGRLVRAILRGVPDLPRLRLSSLDSVEVGPDLLDAFAHEERLMPHLHLSLQAGDDLVLKRMKRRHGRADAIALCRTVRALRPDTVFGADLIAGFPTESDAMFARTLDLVAECDLVHLHVFPFSARPGTPASRMPAVPGSVVRERAARLREAANAAFALHGERETGRVRTVLVEGSGLGRTEGFAPVRFASRPPKGVICDVRIGGHDGRALLAAA